MPEDQAPPVVAVVVANDSGPWLEECLASVREQDYANCSILVVDAASSEPLAARVANVVPEAYLHRLSDNLGFGPSANTVTTLVEGAAYYLFCHDDVVLEVDALRRLVEEAFRSNAAITSPKLVDYDEPDRILQLGLGVDRFAAPVRRVEHREFDQAQHDEAREVFAVPGAATLVRADLFEAIGGFDPQISMFGEDVDLCWRARLVGARIVVVPQAIARHLEATAARRRPLPESRALQWRHELRAVLKNYGRTRRALIVSQLVVLSLAEMVYFALIGRRRRSKEVVEAWRWNLAPARDLDGARRAVVETREVSDHEISSLFSSRTSRIGRFVRNGAEELILRWQRRRDPQAALRGGRPRPHRERRPRYVTVIALVTAVVLVFGARSLISGKLPLIGEFLPLPSPMHLLANFFGGSTDAGMQRPGPASPAYFFLGIAGIVAFGAMGLLLKIVLIAAVCGGAFGTARIVRPFGSPLARLAAGVVYLFLPLAWNELALGDVRALAIYAGTPWLLLRLLRATGVAPFVSGARPPLNSSRTAREALWLGIVVAAMVSVDPEAIVIVVIMAGAIGVSCLAAGEPGAGARVAAIAGASVGVAFVVCFPWSIQFVQPGARWSVLTGAAPVPAANPSLSALLRLQDGPIGAGLLGWAFLAAALFVVLAGRVERFSWAIRLWTVALVAVLVAWVASEGWLGAGGGDLLVLLTPFACAIAVLVGLGVATILADLRHVLFGWRHVAATIFVVIGAAGLLPVLGASLPGHFSVPSTGYDAVLSFTNASGPQRAGQRIMWIGDPQSLPLSSWQIAPGLAFGISEGGLPDATRLFPAANPSAGAVLERAVLSSQAGLTVRLGSLLASDGIRYVIVPTAIAPVLPAAQGSVFQPPPSALVAGLAAQTDLRELPAEGGALVFLNTVWHPGNNVAVALRTSGGTPPALRTLAIMGELCVWAAGLFYVTRRRRRARAQHARRSAARSHLGDVGMDVKASEDAAPQDAVVSLVP